MDKPDEATAGKYIPDPNGGAVFASLSPDDLQNEILLIMHHAEDALKGLKDGDVNYAVKGLLDIQESAERLCRQLPGEKQEGISKIVDQENADALAWVRRKCKFAMTEAWQEGKNHAMNAQADDQILSNYAQANPYPSGTNESEQWFQGFHEGLNQRQILDQPPMGAQKGAEEAEPLDVYSPPFEEVAEA